MRVKYYIKKYKYYLAMVGLGAPCFGNTYVSATTSKLIRGNLSCGEIILLNDPQIPKQYIRNMWVMSYPDLQTARSTARFQFGTGAYAQYPDGLTIERVVSRFFGLWKKYEQLSI